MDAVMPQQQESDSESRERRFARRLEKLDVYFRTIAALLVSALSIYLGITANSIATKQTQVVERELRILESETLPQLEAWQYHGQDADYIYISNTGGPVRRLTSSTTCYLILNGRYSSRNGFFRVFLPSSWYATLHKPGSSALTYEVPEAAGQQHIEIRSSYGASTSLREVGFDLLKAFDGKASLDTLFFVSVVYVDSLGEAHEEVLFSPGVRSIDDPYVIDGYGFEVRRRGEYPMKEFLLSWEGSRWDVRRENLFVTPEQMAQWSDLPTEAEINLGYFSVENLSVEVLRSIIEHYQEETQ